MKCCIIVTTVNNMRTSDHSIRRYSSLKYYSPYIAFTGASEQKHHLIRINSHVQFSFKGHEMVCDPQVKIPRGISLNIPYTSKPQ